MRRLVVVWCMVVVRSRCCHRRPVPSSPPPSSPVRDCFVRNGSAPPALAAVVSGDWRFGGTILRELGSKVHVTDTTVTGEHHLPKT
jgi:hypothetical protein